MKYKKYTRFISSLAIFILMIKFHTAHAALEPLVNSHCQQTPHYPLLQESIYTPVANKNAHFEYFMRPHQIDTLQIAGDKTPEKIAWQVGYTNPLHEVSGRAEFNPYIGIDIPADAVRYISQAANSDASGSQVAHFCHQNNLAGAFFLNLYDAPKQNIVYGGVFSDFFMNLVLVKSNRLAMGKT